MTRAELEVLWAKVRTRFDAAVRLLPNPVLPREDGGSLEAYQDWLSHNELELALDELDILGESNPVPRQYWLELAAAAELMKLNEHEARYRARFT